jgi:hypothetical protein
VARILSTVTTETLADHRTVAVLDEGGTLPLPRFSSWIEVTDNGIHLATLADGEDVAVTVEVWDAEPPAAPGSWAATSEGTVRFATGRLGVNFLVEGDDTVEIEIPPGAYRVRAHAEGRPDLAGEVAAEAYLLRLWPTSPDLTSAEDREPPAGP